jgi:hypothetical protein
MFERNTETRSGRNLKVLVEEMKYVAAGPRLESSVKSAMRKFQANKAETPLHVTPPRTPGDASASPTRGLS